MTHIHIPDGILPVPLWALGFVLLFIALGLSLFRLRAMDMRKKIPLLGAVSAVMLVAMSLEILPIAYHINLSVVAGILLGPALGFVAAFIANLVLSLMGHGGITVIGLNTVLLGSEALLGHTLFYLLRGRMQIFWRAFLVTVVSLFLVTLLLIGMVAVSDLDPGYFTHEAEQGHAFKGHISIATFATLALSLGSIGWLIEAAITGSVLKFIAQVKPELLSHVLHSRNKAGGLS